MSAMLSKSLPLSSNFTMDEEARASEKQGIVSILGSDFDKAKTTPSLRRTLSADMSSKKWLAQNGFSPVKKISSSHELLASIDDSSSASSDDEEDSEERKDLDEKERLDIWNSIQEGKMNKDQEPEKANKLTNWATILSQKREDSKSLPAPYVHPLMKRTGSTLSEKSLEICTESLGSETGSDGFSSYLTSEVEDAEDDKAEENVPEQVKQQPPSKEEYDLPPVKYNHYLGPKKAAQTFPPPLPSLSRENGTSMSMRSSRSNGRLVLEAVSVSSQNNFQAQRHEGRLILTFVTPTSAPTQEVENVKAAVEEERKLVMELDEGSVVFNEKCEDEEIANEEEAEELEEPEGVGEPLKLDRLYGAKETRFSMEREPNMPSGVVNLHKLALMMNKQIGLPNRNPKWASKFNEVVTKHIDAAEEEGDPISLQQSLPLQPQVARMISTPVAKTTSSFNAYEYFWRTKPTTTPSVNIITKQPLSSLKNYSNNCSMSKKSPSGQNEVYYAGAPIVKSCNEPRRSLYFWEPNCIATS